MQINKEKKIKIPAKPALCADLLFQTREKRLKIQKEVEKLQALETALKNYFIETLPKSSATGIAGKIARVQTDRKTIPVVNDWDVFYKFVKKTGRFEFLHRRLSEAPVIELWDAKKEVPGIGRFNAVTVSCTALKSK